MNNSIGKFLVYFMVVVFSVVTGIMLIKSLIEFVIYGEAIILRFTKNVYAAIADIVVLCAAYPVCTAVDPLLKKFNRK